MCLIKRITKIIGVRKIKRGIAVINDLTIKFVRKNYAMFGFGKNALQENREDFEIKALPYLADLFRIARWLVRDREETEDLVQETYA